MPLRCYDKRGPNDNQEEGKELAAREWPNQCSIGFPEIFHHDSKDRVTNEEQSGQNAVRLARTRPHKPQNREQYDSFEEGFINL